MLTNILFFSRCEDQLIANDKEIDQKDTNLRQCRADLEESNQAKVCTAAFWAFQDAQEKYM